MTVKSAQQWSGVVVTRDATGALAAAAVGPAGALYVDGTANAAVVTISGANPYKWTVTLPALTAGQCVSMYLTATIGAIATAAVVAEDVADTALNSDLATTMAGLASEADIADAVADELLAGHAIAGSVGQAITDILLDTGTDGVVVATASKTGYALAATGLDSITATDPGAVASTFPQMVVQLWRRFFKKATMTATQVKTYADDGATVVTTQTVSDDSTTQTQGAAT